MGQPAVLPSRRLHRGGWLLRLVIIHSERVSGPTLHECASCWLLRTLRSYVKFAVSSGRNGAGRELSLHVERVRASSLLRIGANSIFSVGHRLSSRDSEIFDSIVKAESASALTDPMKNAKEPTNPRISRKGLARTAERRAV